MTEQDVLDEGSELPGLRELHRQDRMPEDVRERLMRRMRMPSAQAHADAGLRQVSLDLASDLASHGGGDTGPDPGLNRGGGRDGDVDGAPPRLARPRWASSLVEGAGRVPGVHRRRLGWGLGAAALVAAGMALFIGAPALRFGVEPQAASDTPISSESAGGASGPDRTIPDELRVVGWLEQGSLKRLAVPGTEARGACRFGFHLRPLTVDSNAVLRVEYPRCRIPETLANANGGCVKVTAEGRLAADGHLEAKRVMAQFVQCQP
jgi:cytochrome c-type biogenesis protein CcmE